MTTTEADIIGLGQLAKKILGPAVSVGYACPEACSAADLMPQERASIADMVPKRQREFAAGRSAARMAALADGVAPFAVPMGPDRAPIWPDGVTGSIAHTDDACLAVVSRNRRLASIGLDLERDTPLPSCVTDAICCGADRAGNAEACQVLGDRYGLVVFSAKEAAYKCQYPLTGTLIDFDALSIRLSPDEGTFVARFERQVGAFSAGAAFSGCFALFDGHVLSAAWITRSQWAAIAGQSPGVANG